MNKSKKILSLSKTKLLVQFSIHVGLVFLIIIYTAFISNAFSEASIKSLVVISLVIVTISFTIIFIVVIFIYSIILSFKINQRLSKTDKIIAKRIRCLLFFDFLIIFSLIFTFVFYVKTKEIYYEDLKVVNLLSKSN